jgi:calcineurin-like phosphoesterase family protein
MTGIFFISDNHFGSPEVIKTFRRPFKDVREMDREMIKRWNSTVSPYDTVFSLGDFTWLPTLSYLDQLNGHKVMVRGNHDWGPDAGGNHLVLHAGMRTFLLIHDPDKVPPRAWRGWVIHGHHHWMPEYPFIDSKWKTINVSCELIDYTPISLDRILALDLENLGRPQTLADAEELMEARERGGSP